MMPLLTPLAFADSPVSPSSPLVSMIPVLIIFAIFYFLLLAPMRKRQKAAQKMLEALKRGDRVVTNGGLYGEVAAVEGGVVHLKIADGVKVRVAKSAISGLESPEQEGAK